jgi:hypothetical protein
LERLDGPSSEEEGVSAQKPCSVIEERRKKSLLRPRAARNSTTDRMKISHEFSVERAKQVDKARAERFERKYEQNERRMAQKERLWQEKKELILKLLAAQAKTDH